MKWLIWSPQYKVTLSLIKGPLQKLLKDLSAAPVKHMRNRQLIDVLCYYLDEKESDYMATLTALGEDLHFRALY